MVRSIFVSISLVGVLLAVGCKGTTTPSEERRFLQLEARIAKLSDSFERYYQDLSKEFERLKKRMIDMEGDLIYLKAKLSTPEPPPKESPNQVQLRRIKNIIQALKSGSISPEGAITDLSKMSPTATAELVKSLQDAKRRGDFNFTEKLEIVLGGMEPEDLSKKLLPLLEEKGLENSVIKIVGYRRKLSLSKAIERLLNSPDRDLRFLCAEALIKCKNKKAIPSLIEFLRVAEGGYNILAFDLLKRYVKRSFGYKIYAPPRENKEAIRAWENWWKENADEFKFPP
jgi:hypothetical protein